MVELTVDTAADLLEAAPDAVMVVSAEGRIIVVNAQVERLFGYQREDLVGQSVELVVPEAGRSIDPAQPHSFLRAVPSHRPGTRVRLTGRRRDGTEFPAEISLSIIDSSGGPAVFSTIRDVTDRLHEVEAQARLAAIVQSSDDAIIGTTPDGVVRSWNPAATRIYGYTAAEVIGHSIDLLTEPERRDAEVALRARVAAGGQSERRRTARLRKDGTPVAVSMTITPIVDGTQGIVGLASISRDLSEREIAEAKFRALLEAGPDAIIGVGTGGRIVLTNAQAERLFGYEPDTLVGTPVEALIPRDARAEHVQQRAHYFANPHPKQIRITALRRDGSEFPAEVSLAALEAEEGMVVSASVRDVTERLEAEAERERLRGQAERERLESQLHQSRRLESLGQLAGGVAHDFNNLLGVILNYAEFVAEDVATAATGGPGATWEQITRDVAQIQRAAQRAIALTHQLLAFGRQEVVRPRVINVNSVVTDVEQLLRRTLGEHVKLSTTLREDLWPVKADPGQLEQVLVNLAVNSRHAMPSGGMLTIETDNQLMDEGDAAQQLDLPPGRYVRLRVSDTGVGMPKEVSDRAFEPFFSTKPKGEGSGLGLATVYGIINQADGRVWIYSEPGLGTTITALIPATDEQTETAEVPGIRARQAGGETILLVEDEDAMREVTERILRRNGYRVLTASGGPPAVQLAATYPEPIDLLLTDVIMPVMLGKEVATYVQAARPSIRVLYMSGYALPVLTDQGTLDPRVTLLEKPFSEVALLDAVRQVLDAQAVVPEPATAAG